MNGSRHHGISQMQGESSKSIPYIVQNLKVPHYIAINEAAHAALFAYPFQGRIGVFGFTISAYPALQDNQILITPLPSDRWIRCRRFPWRSFGKVARYDETKPNPP
jgi:hypothetical protein